MSDQIVAVRRTLVGSGDQALYVSGKPNGLAAGQMGVFDENGDALTTVALGETVQDKIFVAVGLGNGKFRRTPGYIKAASLKAVNFQCYTAAVQKIVDIEDMCSECDGERYIKIIVTSSNAWTGYGYNQYVKTFAAREGCCTGSVTCKAILKDLRDQINNDDEGLFTAVATNPSNDATLNDAALDSWDYGANGCPNLRISANAQAVSDFVGIPELYDWPTGVAFEVVAKGFQCCADGTTVTVDTEITYAEGAGADIKYLEWTDAGNAEAGPYRQTVSGVVTPITTNAVAGGTYHQLNLLYTEPIAGDTGAMQYSDPKEAIIAMPSGTTAVTLWTVLDDQLGTTLETTEGAC